MDRYAENHLLKWYGEENRKPLIIRGARQVGKSSLVREFARNNKITLVEINLEKIKLKTIEQEDVNIDHLILEIEVLFKVKVSSKTILFFDEIQEAPRLLSYFRFLYEEHPEIPILGAGSLLEFLIKEGNYSFPVGRVEFFYLSPMSFTEFLLALGERELLQILEENEDLPAFTHDKLTEFLRIYYYVGGMPEAVLQYVKSKNLDRVRTVHRSIVQTYEADFPKYAKEYQVKYLKELFQKMPRSIGEKVKYSKLFPEVRSIEVKKAIQILIDARILLPAYHSNGTESPLKGQMDESVYKLYFLDIGLLNYCLGLEKDHFLAGDVKNLFEGKIAEQFVAQHLAYREKGVEEPQLFYWLRDKKKNNAEVDFLIEKNRIVYPLEVKSCHSARLHSTFMFLYEKRKDRAIKVNLSPFSRQKQSYKITINSKLIKGNFTLWTVPLYQIEFVLRLILLVKDL